MKRTEDEMIHFLIDQQGGLVNTIRYLLERLEAVENAGGYGSYGFVSQLREGKDMNNFPQRKESEDDGSEIVDGVDIRAQITKDQQKDRFRRIGDQRQFIARMIEHGYDSSDEIFAEAIMRLNEMEEDYRAIYNEMP